MKTLILNANEIRALEAFLWCNPCRAGCAYEEMHNSKKDCSDCKLKEAEYSIMDKLFGTEQ